MHLVLALEPATRGLGGLSDRLGLVVFAGTGGYQGSGTRDGGGGREAQGTTERGGETDEHEPPPRCVCQDGPRWAFPMSWSEPCPCPTCSWPRHHVHRREDGGRRQIHLCWKRESKVTFLQR